MTGSDMAYFMTKNRCQLSFRVQVSEQAPVHINKATRQGKGVNIGAVDYGKYIVQFWPVRHCSHLLANFFNVGL